MYEDHRSSAYYSLGGMPIEKWCDTRNIHPREANGLTFLDQFSLEEAQYMMTSPEWTRAVFVRNPKPRILSAFLDKAVHGTDHFVENECVVYGDHLSVGNTKVAKLHVDECIAKHKNFDFFLHNITTHMNKNRHWRSINSAIDEKWWPWINFIGKMDYLHDDAEILLNAIKSDRDGMTAWQRAGATGWSGMERIGVCNGAKAFLEQDNDDLHATHAKQKMQQYYTPELEKFVEEHYADDLNNTHFYFDN